MIVIIGLDYIDRLIIKEEEFFYVKEVLFYLSEYLAKANHQFPLNAQRLATHNNIVINIVIILRLYKKLDLKLYLLLKSKSL